MIPFFILVFHSYCSSLFAIEKKPCDPNEPKAMVQGAGSELLHVMNGGDNAPMLPLMTKAKFNMSEEELKIMNQFNLRLGQLTRGIQDQELKTKLTQDFIIFAEQCIENKLKCDSNGFYFFMLEQQLLSPLEKKALNFLQDHFDLSFVKAQKQPYPKDVAYAYFLAQAKKNAIKAENWQDFILPGELAKEHAKNLLEIIDQFRPDIKKALAQRCAKCDLNDLDLYIQQTFKKALSGEHLSNEELIELNFNYSQLMEIVGAKHLEMINPDLPLLGQLTTNLKNTSGIYINQLKIFNRSKKIVAIPTVRHKTIDDIHQSMEHGLTPLATIHFTEHVDGEYKSPLFNFRHDVYHYYEIDPVGREPVFRSYRQLEKRNLIPGKENVLSTLFFHLYHEENVPLNPQQFKTRLTKLLKENDFFEMKITFKQNGIDFNQQDILYFCSEFLKELP